MHSATAAHGVKCGTCQLAGGIPTGNSPLAILRSRALDDVDINLSFSSKYFHDCLKLSCTYWILSWEKMVRSELCKGTWKGEVYPLLIVLLRLHTNHPVPSFEHFLTWSRRRLTSLLLLLFIRHFASKF
eukprot:756447-Hanusia_phi.AAC.2